MKKPKTAKRPVFTFKHFARKGYSVFCSLKREIRIGCLSVATLAAIHNDALASRNDSLEIIQQIMSDNELSEIVVNGRIPVSLEQSATKTEIISREEIEKAKVQSVNDLLKLCASVDVRQRGAMGVQTDIGIGGGTNEQVCILINGISVNNPQTGHLTADFPVAIHDIERIEVYDGASARCFGSQALNGAINIITNCGNKTNAGAYMDAGSYGTLGIGSFGVLSLPKCNQRISAGYMRSDGATHNNDFQRIKSFYQGNCTMSNLNLDWQVGYNYQRYGANSFYSADYPDQWERNNRVLSSLKGHTRWGRVFVEPLVSIIRSYDHFQLIRGTHFAENFHRNNVYTAALNTYVNWLLGRTAIGGELRYEDILSTNLGKPLSENRYVPVEGHSDIYYTRNDNRMNSSFFLEHLFFIKKVTLSTGMMVNKNTSVNNGSSLYPGIDISWRCFKGIKLYASWNKSLRLPSFTDLYYKSPTQQGNMGLKPEKTSTLKIGADYKCKGYNASLQAIYRHGKNMIDWVMFHPDDIYHSTQYELDNYEFLAQFCADFPQLFNGDTFFHSFRASYMCNYQKRSDDVDIFKSNYALEYLKYKLSVNLSHKLCGPVNASWFWLLQDRMGGYFVKNTNTGSVVLRPYSPYSLVNVKINYRKPNHIVYISFENITNHTYYDYGNIPQPGFSVMAGIEYHMK